MQSIRDKTMFAIFVAALYVATGGVFYLAATREYHPVAGFDGIRLTMLVLLMPLLVKYVFQLACSPFYWLKCRRQEGRMKGQTPSVSVLIPAWNEEVGIVKTISSVLNTEYPRLQIVVINDGSTDCTHEIVTRFIAD